MEIDRMKERVKELKNDIKDIDKMIAQKTNEIREKIDAHNLDNQRLVDDKKHVIGKVDMLNELIKLKKSEKEKDGE